MTVLTNLDRSLAALYRVAADGSGFPSAKIPTPREHKMRVGAGHGFCCSPRPASLDGGWKATPQPGPYTHVEVALWQPVPDGLWSSWEPFAEDADNMAAEKLRVFGWVPVELVESLLRGMWKENDE